MKTTKQQPHNLLPPNNIPEDLHLKATKLARAMMRTPKKVTTGNKNPRRN